MVQTTHLSDQKRDHMQLSHTARDAQSTTRRRKITQNRREAASKSSTPLPLSRNHHVLIYVDKKGEIKVDCSSTLTDDEQRKILQAALPEYCQAWDRIKANSTLSSFALKAEAADRTSHAGTQHHPKADTPVPASDHALSNTQLHKRAAKRRRSSSEEGSSCLQDDNASQVTEQSSPSGTIDNQTHMIGIEIQDLEKLKEYLFDAFTSFQQINCRTLCKSWIRTIEPKKQVNHPYNGNLKVKGVQKSPTNEVSTQRDSDPEETKPRWWPSKEDCPHKEPDHIKKEQRLALLCHILMNTGELHDCSTNDLRQAIESDRAKIKPVGKESILEDVWKIGNQLERVKRGEIDGTTKVMVNARKEEARMIRGGGRSRKPLDAKDESDDEENSEDPDTGPQEVKITPSSPSALASSAHYLRTDQVPTATQVRMENCAYRDDLSAHHFRPPEIKDHYQDHRPEYPMAVEVNPTMGEMPHHESSGHVFNGEALPENSFGNMQDIRSHADLFSPDEQQIIGQWAISATPDLYPMQYTGEPSQPPAINPRDGDHIFGHFSYPNIHKPPYQNNDDGYGGDNQSPFPAGYEDDLARFQHFNTCSIPPHPKLRHHHAGMMHQHPYDLPSHIRA